MQQVVETRQTPADRRRRLSLFLSLFLSVSLSENIFFSLDFSCDTRVFLSGDEQYSTFAVRMSTRKDTFLVGVSHM